MKKNKKGFMLIETLIVSISISGILIFLYVQFSNVNDSYIKSYNYNSVEGMYKATDVKENIIFNGKDKIYDDITSNSFADLSLCPSIYYDNTNYCTKLYEIANVKTVIVTKGNLHDINELMKSSVNVNKYSENLRDFISKIESFEDGYQIIVEYNDDTVAAVRMEV